MHFTFSSVSIFLYDCNLENETSSSRDFVKLHADMGYMGSYIKHDIYISIYLYCHSGFNDRNNFLIGKLLKQGCIGIII